MIELERSRDGYIKSFSFKVAEKELRKLKARKEAGQTYWKLPDDSNHRMTKDGFLVKKTKKKSKD